MDMDNIYLIPANAKKSLLYFGIFNKFDALLFGSGCLITLLFLFIFPSGEILTSILVLLPAGITGLLVFPLPNYHNVLGGIVSVFKYFYERRNYIWKGWCFNENAEETSE